MTRAPRIRLSGVQQFSVVDSGCEEHNYACCRLLQLKDLCSVAVKCKKTDVWDVAMYFFFPYAMFSCLNVQCVSCRGTAKENIKEKKKANQGTDAGKLKTASKS